MFHTIASAANAEIPQDRKLDGVDLLPFINQTAPGVPHKTLFWKQGHQQTVLHEGWKLIRADDPLKQKRVEWLFNLSVDSIEQRNLAMENAGKLTLLNRLLDEHIAELPGSAWPMVVNSAHLVDKTAIDEYEETDAYIYWPN